MSDLHSELPFVGYPRGPVGMRYGSVERLEALGTGYIRLRLMLLFLVAESALILIKKQPSLTAAEFMVLLTFSLGAYWTAEGGLTQIMTGLGWNKTLGKVCSIVPIMIVPAWIGIGAGTAWAMTASIASSFVFLIAISSLVNRELRRYGFRINTVSLNPKKAFERELDKRRFEDAYQGLPPIPDNLFSGEGPA